MRFVDTVAGLVRDVRYGLRTLVRSPGFSLTAVLTLALGIGGTAAVFSMVRGVLLAPLPYEGEERIHVFWSEYDWLEAEFDFVRERLDAHEYVAAYTILSSTYMSEGRARLVPSVQVTADFFRVFGRRPALGRGFQEGEDRVGAEGVMVVSHGFWAQELGADPGAVGSLVHVDGIPRRVVGVMPPGFYYPSPEFEIWIPFAIDPTRRSYTGNGYLGLVGRLEERVGPTRSQAALASLVTGLGETFTYSSAWDRTRNAHLIPIREHLVGDVRPTLVLVLGAAALALLVACANVAALVLGRSADRTREMAIRVTMGASRGRLTSQILSETLVLGLVGGLAGLGVAVGGFRGMLAMLPLDPALKATLGLDWWLMGGVFALALGSGLLVGLFPVVSVLRGGLRAAIPGTRQESTVVGGRSRLQTALVVAEVFLAVVLVTGAGLLVRSVANLHRVDPGLDVEGLLAMDVVAGGGDFSSAERRAIVEEVVAAVRALPGVEGAAVIPRLPLRDDGMQGPVAIEDYPDMPRSDRPNTKWRNVTAGFFEVAGVDLVEGRTFTEADREDSQPVTVISRSFAERFWPDRSPLGRRIDGPMGGEGAVIVGVVDDIRWEGLRNAPPLAMYRPWRQSPFFTEVHPLLIRTTGGDPAAVARSAREAIHGLDARLAVARILPMPDILKASIAVPLRVQFFFSLFGGLALVLGVVGVYGVLSYHVARRSHEFGVRMALGARPWGLVRLVMGQGIRMVAVGVALGILTSVIAGDLLASLLFGVDPLDPPTLVASTLTLLAAGLGASYLPAWRAGRSDPVRALRAE